MTLQRAVGGIWLIVSLLLGCLVPNAAEAAATLTVRGLRGGAALDLGELGDRRRQTTEEATVTMDIGAPTQYRLTQFLATGLVNERGTRLTPEQVVFDITGVDTGTERHLGVMPLSRTPTELFISSATGQPEEFVIVYSASAERLPEVGTYDGNINFTLQAVNGTAFKSATLRIRLRVAHASGFEFEPGSPRRISFGTINPGEQGHADALHLRVTNNAPGPLDVQQVLEHEIRNAKGDLLPVTAIQVSGAGGDFRLPVTPLAPRATLIRQDLRSAGPLRLSLVFDVTIPPRQAAGTYRGAIRLSVGSAGSGSSGSVLLPVDIEVPSVLSISVTSAQGRGSEMYFPSVTMGEPTTPVEVQVEVESNLEVPLQFFQELKGPFFSQQGERLPPEIMSFDIVDFFVQGTLRTSPMGPMSTQRRPIYQSSAKGGSMRFMIRYHLNVPAQAPPGIYEGNVTYSVTPRS